MPHPSQLADEQLLKQCHVRRQRRSGPGGQHRNKVETGIFLEHTPTGVQSAATERRSQPKNQELATFRLRVNLAIQHRAIVQVEPSQLWRERCRNGQISVSVVHRDFPTLLAESLDFLSHHQWDAKSAAESLGSTTTQLVKFLKKEPRAFQQLNNARIAAGLRALR